MNSKDQSIQKVADTVRVLSAAMVEKAKSGHPGGPMGAADFISVLFTEFLNYDPQDSEWLSRDRFYLDAGHMSPMLYSILAVTGRLELDDLKNFRQWGSKTPGHPEVDHLHGIENTSGPLGQGHVFGVGSAIANRYLSEKFSDWLSHDTYLFISDGGIQEEVSQGAGRIAGHLGLGGVTMFYDSNKVQLSTHTSSVTTEDTAAKYRAWGWHVIEIDGNDIAQIRQALKSSKSETSRPSLIIGNTVMAKGALTEDNQPFENQVSTHGQPLSKAGASTDITIEKLGADPDNPFVIPDEVSEFVSEQQAIKASVVESKRAAEKKWRTENEIESKLLNTYLERRAPKIDWQKIMNNQSENVATRASSSVVLAELAENVGNMIVMSADLSNSDKTDGFLKKTTEITADSWTGQFLQVGVSEFTMADLAIGMSLHGGIIPVCATFFAFSDYQKPALRLAALMEQPAIFLWTHDAFRVGEDGPTHQPIEQEAQLRLLEKVRNHSDKPSFLALRPADAAETTVAWKMAVENTNTPTGLILTRQNITDIPAHDRFAQASEATKGAYTILDVDDPDVIVIANGSEVGTAYEAITGHNIKARLVSVPSEGLFREQTKEYQETVLPDDVPRFGITAGLGVNMGGLVGDSGQIHSRDMFGFSAPADVLDEKFGFTAENIASEIKQFLAKK